MRLLVTTTSSGKLRDFAAAAAVHGIAIEPLPGLESVEPVEEDGATFEENAIKKALAYSLLAPGEIVVADDSGLEVDALGGAPGVRSARFAADAGRGLDGRGGDDANNRLLMERMESVPPHERQARYVSVIAAASGGALLHTSRGTVEGRILNAPEGVGGFGYDPLFFVPAVGRTMAEITPEQKHALSHRGRAFRSLLAWLSASRAAERDSMPA